MKKYLFLPVSILLFSCHHSEQAGNKQGTIKAGGFNVYYERTGSGNAIVFLHAGLQDHTMWQEQVNELSKDHEVITLDLPFHGKTSGSDTAILAADVIRIVLDSLQLQKVAVAGLSMGGSIAQDFIIAYPQRANKAILISSGINGAEEEHPVDAASMAWWAQFKKAMDEKDTVMAATVFTRAWAEGIYRLGDSLEAPASQYVYKTTLANLRLHKMEGWPLLQGNPRAYKKIASINIPVLIIEGDKDLPYIRESSVLMEKMIPGARRIVIKDVAHMLNLEKPAELNKIIVDFLKEK